MFRLYGRAGVLRYHTSRLTLDRGLDRSLVVAVLRHTAVSQVTVMRAGLRCHSVRDVGPAKKSHPSHYVLVFSLQAGALNITNGQAACCSLVSPQSLFLAKQWHT